MQTRGRGRLWIVTLWMAAHTVLAQTPAGNVRAEAEARLRAADSLRDKARTREARGEALAAYAVALELWRKAGDSLHEAQCLVSMAQLQDLLGRRDVAAGLFDESLSLSRKASSQRWEGAALYGLGKMRYAEGDVPGAIRYYEQAAPLRHAAGDLFEEAIVLHNLGVAHWTLGENEKALASYERAMELRRQVGDKAGVAYTLQGRATVFWTWGEVSRALAEYGEALRLWRELKNRYGEADVLNATGLLHSSLRDDDQASHRYQEALALWRELQSPVGEAYTRNNMGLLALARNDTAQARTSFEQALPPLESAGDQRGVAYVLQNTGDVWAQMNDPGRALPFYTRSLEIKLKIGDRYGEAYARQKVGEAQLALDNSTAAIEAYEAALALHREVGNRAGQAATLAGLSRAERKTGKLEAARTHIEEALERIEGLRSKLPGDDLRATYFASTQTYYSYYIDLLMQLHQSRPEAGFDALALEASERSKARVLLEAIAEPDAEVRKGADAELLKQERSLLLRLNALAQRLQRIYSGSHKTQEALLAQRQFDDALRQRQTLEALIRQTSPAYAALTQPRPMPVEAIRRELLDPQTQLLEISLGPERSYAWLVSQREITTLTLPPESEIDELARKAYRALTARNEQPDGETADQRVSRLKRADAAWRTASTQLSAILLRPLRARLTAARLIVVADGVLQYLPFAALPLGGKPLVTQYAITREPSASVAGLLGAEPAARAPAMAILADPVYTAADPRVQRQPRQNGVPETTTRGAEGLFPRLRFSRSEADRIAALAPAGKVRKLVDFAADSNLVRGNRLAAYGILHFATHTEINNERPALSRIVLSLVDEQGRPRDGFVRLYEIYNLNLHSDLVVLSACRTALGREVRGEGFMGLTRGFLYAGASRVLASLWSVEDRATAEFMYRFYQRMLRQGQAPSAALRSAQLSLLRDPRWSHPYYWAAFLLQGEWR